MGHLPGIPQGVEWDTYPGIPQSVYIPQGVWEACWVYIYLRVYGRHAGWYIPGYTMGGMLGVTYPGIYHGRHAGYTPRVYPMGGMPYTPRVYLRVREVQRGAYYPCSLGGRGITRRVLPLFPL